MNGYYWKVESIHSSRILLLLFSLLASISLTPSEFIDCQSLFPDENLDFLGISAGWLSEAVACLPCLPFYPLACRSAICFELASSRGGIFLPFDEFPHGISNHHALLSRFQLSFPEQALSSLNLMFTLSYQSGDLAIRPMTPRV